MTDAILVLNAGSSSLKFSIFGAGEPPQTLVRGQLDGLFTQPRFVASDATGRNLGERSWPAELGHRGAVEFLFGWFAENRSDNHLVAAGHRVVHGGLEFDRPVLIDGAVLTKLDALVPLAPLHQPHNLAAIRAVAEHMAQLPQVACFDTSFHRTQPVLAQAFALPQKYSDEGIRRYGFHGISYEYIATALGSMDARAANGRTVVAHLGNGASMCAMKAGKSVATTMGFTALDGLPMGTRCGAIDPGVLLYLMNQHGMDAEALARLLYHESGLLGVSEVSSDMRALLASSDPRARAAVDLFVYRIGRELGSLAAALRGLDALVFTGGIGENAAVIRERVCRDASWLGMELDSAANKQGGPRITASASPVGVWVIPTNEELMIAQHTLTLCNSRN